MSDPKAPQARARASLRALPTRRAVMYRELARTIGSVARGARTEAKLTQAQVAEVVGIATEVYGRLERGLMLPSVETLVKLCRALRVSATALMGLDKADPSSVLEPLPDLAVRPGVQRVIARAEELDGRQLRLLIRVAAALSRPRK